MLTDDKINHLSHLVAEVLSEDERVEFKDVYNNIRLSIRRSIGKAMQKEQEIRRAVEEKIRALKRNVLEGSSEWETLFFQYYEEEIAKLRSIK